MEKSCFSQEIRGLEIGCLRNFNVSKWWWRIKMDGNSLWPQSIMAIHNFNGMMITSARLDGSV